MAGSILARYSDMLRDGLWDVVPQWVRTMFFADPPARPLRFGDGRTRGAIMQPMATLTTQGRDPKRARTVDAVLPTNMLLERIIPIPPSTPTTHRAIAALDLLRRTPFAPDDVHWTIGGDNTAKSEHLTQWIAKKADIVHFRAMLASHGYRVRRFVIDDGHGQAVLADFTADIAPRAGMWRKANAALLIAIIGAGMAIWLQPAWQARAEVNRETIVVERLRNEALELRTDIEALNQIDSERTAFVNAVMRRPRAVDAIRQLTVALPDSVWATDLLFTENQITLNGETAQSAADLVLALTQSNLAYVPALAGPVSRTAQGRERFGIVFTAKGVNP